MRLLALRLISWSFMLSLGISLFWLVFWLLFGYVPSRRVWWNPSDMSQLWTVLLGPILAAVFVTIFTSNGVANSFRLRNALVDVTALGVIMGLFCSFLFMLIDIGSICIIIAASVLVVSSIAYRRQAVLAIAVFSTSYGFAVAMLCGLVNGVVAGLLLATGVLVVMVFIILSRIPDL